MKVGVLFGTPHHWNLKFDRAMIDYIRASMPIDCKDTKIFLNLQNPDVFSSGWLRYYLDGCKKMDCAKVKNLVRLEFVLYATKKDQVLAKEIGFMCKPVSTIPESWE